MIVINDKVLTFIKFLNDKKLTTKTVELIFLPYNDSVVSPDGDMGFAVFMIEENKIYLPIAVNEQLKAELDKDNADYVEFLLFSLAHEYKHFLQDIKNSSMTDEELEKDADDFAEAIMKEFLEWYYADANANLHFSKLDKFEVK